MQSCLDESAKNIEHGREVLNLDDNAVDLSDGTGTSQLISSQHHDSRQHLVAALHEKVFPPALVMRIDMEIADNAKFMYKIPSFNTEFQTK